MFTFNNFSIICDIFNFQTFCDIFGKCKHLEHNMNIQTIQIKLIF